jgi:hypothetical protein
VLKPKDSASLVSEVRIAIDGKQHVPTRVEVFAKGYADRAAFEIGFTQVSFTRPDPAVFTFKPPAGAKVTEADKDAASKDAPAPGKDATAPGKDATGKPASEPKTVVLGQGWTAVLVARLPQDSSAPKNAPNNGGQVPGITGFLNNLPQVHGSFGTGRVLNSRLFTALLLDDGRILVGAVNQDRLVAAASDPAAALK